MHIVKLLAIAKKGEYPYMVKSSKHCQAYLYRSAMCVYLQSHRLTDWPEQ